MTFGNAKLMLVACERKVWTLTRQENWIFSKKSPPWFWSQNEHSEAIFSFRRLIRLSGVKFCPKIKSWEIVCRSSRDVWKCKTNVSSVWKKSLSAYSSGKLNFFKKVTPMVFMPKYASLCFIVVMRLSEANFCYRIFLWETCFKWFPHVLWCKTNLF